MAAAPGGATAPRAATRSGLLAVAGVAGLATAVAMVVAWAATIGPPTLVHGGSPARGTATPTPSPSAQPPAPGSPGQGFVPHEHPVLVTLMTVVAIAFVVTVGYGLVILVRALLSWQRISIRRRFVPPDVDFDVVLSPQAVDALVRAAESQRASLLTGSARNAIVACWHRFETESIEVGITQHPWETSAEFVLRVLDLAEADPPAVATLARLYREARFSTHVIGEDQRSEALAALHAIHAGLASRPSAPTGGAG